MLGQINREYIAKKVNVASKMQLLIMRSVASKKTRKKYVLTSEPLSKSNKFQSELIRSCQGWSDP